MVEPFTPKLTLFDADRVEIAGTLTDMPLELAVIVAFVAPVFVPANCVELYEPVMVEPLRPNDTPLEFEKTTEPNALEVVPAEKFTLPPAPPEMLIDWPFCESVTLGPPARNSVPEDTEAVAPAVLPPITRSTPPPPAALVI